MEPYFSKCVTCGKLTVGLSIQCSTCFSDAIVKTKIGCIPPNQSIKEGRKFDGNKPRTELLPTQALIEVSRVLGAGAKKYAPFDWAKGMDWTRLIGAALRHIFSWIGGEDKDPETKLSHLAHASCCLLFLIEYTLRNKGKDDRFKWETTNV